MENFLLLATVYLTLMIVAVPLAVRLGLGSVLGYLTCGILLGPLVNLTGSDLDALQHFAELGVALMLFLIGLELEPRSLWNMRRKLVGFGAAQIVGTTLLLAVIAILFGLSWQAALVVGMILSLSSTAIVLQTLTEKGLMRTNGGRSAFSVLLTQDIAVILMIALMPLLAPFPHRNGASLHGDEYIGEVFMANLPGWAGTLITLAAVGSVILLGQFAIRPIFRFVISARLREMETAMALLIVVGIASLMILVGLSPALGTFLAGVMLAGSEFRHELESQIEPFKGLLLGLFFITVGAGMDLQLLLEKPVPILGITAALIGTKALVVGIIARMTKMGRTDRSLFTLSLAQAGEFGFVLIAYAVSLAILPKSLAEGFLLVIALSMLVTPLLFIVHGQIRRRLDEKTGSDIPSDDIDEQQLIIIAGVGRFGQTVNRLVTMSGFQTTVLDHDLKVIQVMRRFGFKGYFGDPTRPEILAAAGLDTAGILVAALDDPAANLKLITYARERRPDLHIISRARDRVDVYRLYAAGANDIVRELFDSSLRAGRYVLENAGLSEYEAAELEKIFYRLDRAALRDLAELWKPNVPLEQNTEYVKRSRELNKTLESALINRFAAPTDEFPSDGKDEAKQPETPSEDTRSGVE
ncbi:cation:proton antiporter domain-containing protein [Paracoccus onubensis]|uniref:Potassium transporter n=1 Tax=Paracoccus onubensis TaxID=1675788 RepID=A0A418SRZ1_9RHOB|nr:cation:proton antiporter [Paracoccus onubensis]RJE83736.1 potassium transporter [Paracoccus onubensis]